MPDSNKYPELDSEEIAAIREEMEKDFNNIDRFFLLKLHTLFLLCVYFSTLMLFFPHRVTYWLQVNQAANSEQADNVLLYRGVFVICYLIIAMYSWSKDRYAELVFGSATIMASANFLLDLPYLLGDDYSAAPASFLFGLFVRAFVIALLISVFRNLSRSTYLQGKLFTNPFAPICQQ